jgi:uncharacterized protein YjbI with pentapeptide repeats
LSRGNDGYTLKGRLRIRILGITATDFNGCDFNACHFNACHGRSHCAYAGFAVGTNLSFAGSDAHASYFSRATGSGGRMRKKTQSAARFRKAYNTDANLKDTDKPKTPGEIQTKTPPKTTAHNRVAA